MDPQIELLDAADIPQAMALKDALGWNQTPADWRRFLELAPGGCFKAVAAGGLVGTAVAFLFDRVCWIGMVIVRQEARGRGLGGALVNRGLEHARAQGCDLAVLDATVAGQPLYARLGFRPAGRAVARAVPGEGPVRALRGQLPAGWRLRPLRGDELAAAEALEARAVGVRREPLLRLLLAQCPDSAAACLDSRGNLGGFVLWRPGAHSLQIGPLIAAEEGAAGALLDRALAAARVGGQPPALTVPADRPAVTRLLQARGLRVEPRLTRMVLPLLPPPRERAQLRGEDHLLYAGSGPEKG